MIPAEKYGHMTSSLSLILSSYLKDFTLHLLDWQKIQSLTTLSQSQALETLILY